MILPVGFVGFTQNPIAAVALFSLAGFAHQTLSVTVITMSSDLFKKSEVATVAGMAGTFGNAGVLVFPGSATLLSSSVSACWMLWARLFSGRWSVNRRPF